MQVCTLLQTDNHASTSPLSFLQAGCPFCRPTNSVKVLKARQLLCSFGDIWYKGKFYRLDAVSDSHIFKTLEVTENTDFSQENVKSSSN